MRKLTALLIASSLALGTAGIAHAADAPQGHHEARVAKDGKGPRGPHHEAPFKELNLSEAQKQQVKEILQASHDKARQSQLDERREIHHLIAADTFDAAKAQTQLDKADAARKAQQLSRLETQNKIYNILTPEQKKQYNDNFEKRLTQPPKPEGKPLPAE